MGLPSNRRIRGLYAIIDAEISHGRDLLQLARDYAWGGVSIIQFRNKKKEDHSDLVRRIADLRAEKDFVFVVNDDVALAHACGADGVHVGKGDASIEDCRRVLGPHKIIGYSSHDLEEAMEAEKRGADYVAFGAIYPTTTKGPGHPIQGIERLKNVVSSLKVPVVAIGGIGRKNIHDVLSTGVASVAMITALANSDDRRAESEYFSHLFR